MNTFEITITITEEFLEDVAVTALEGGINYWAAEVKIPEDVEEKCDGMWASQILAKTDEDIFIIDDEDEQHTINRKKLLSGIQLYSQQGNDVSDAGNIDADAADTIFQLAVFNEIVYG